MSKVLMTSMMAAAVLLAPNVGWSHKSIQSTNQAVRVSQEDPVGDVTTVNGAIELAEGAKAANIHTTNGAVTLRNDAQASRITTVNAGIALEDGAVVLGDVSTGNGDIALSPKAVVRGAVQTVHGSVDLESARVAGGIRTTSGNITIGSGSQVEGGVTVGKQESFLQWGHPTVIVGPHAVVQGKLEFKQTVELKVSDTAKIGPVTGATVQIFKGDTP